MGTKTINGAVRELEAARAKGAHTVRISADLLEMLLGAHALLSAAFVEIEAKND